MDLRGTTPGASREPDAGEAEADQEKDARDCESPICGSGNGCVLLGETVVTARLGKTARAGSAESTGAGVAGRGGMGGGMKIAIHWAVSLNRITVANSSWAGNRARNLARPATGFGFHSWSRR